MCSSDLPRPKPRERSASEPARSAIKAVGYEPVTRMDDRHLRRLGAFPDNVAAYLSWTVRDGGKDKAPVVAVLPLQSPRGLKTGETLHRSEELTNALVARKATVVERSRLGQAVHELLGQNQALFDPEKAQKIGKLTGAACVVVGTLTPMGKLAELNIRLVDAETGEIREALTLRDVEGLPDKRKPIVPPTSPQRQVSLLGTWDVMRRDGSQVVWTFRANQMWESTSGNRGTYEQKGDRFTIRFPIHVTSAKKGAEKKKTQVMEWHGQIHPDGPTIEASGEGGGGGTGRRR